MTQACGFCIDGNVVPSVSSILNPLTQKHRAVVRHSPRHFYESNAPRARHSNKLGTEVHAFARSYMRTGKIPKIKKSLQPLWEPLHYWLEQFDADPVWAEGPLLEQHSYMQSGRHACVWSPTHQFAGVPDLIGNFGGVPLVCEFKTTASPFRVGAGCGYRHQLAALQVAAYTTAWNELTDDCITTGMTIVASPGRDAQLFIIDGEEMEKAQSQFQQLASKHRKKLETSSTTPALALASC